MREAHDQMPMDSQHKTSSTIKTFSRDTASATRRRTRTAQGRKMKTQREAAMPPTKMMERSQDGSASERERVFFRREARQGSRPLPHGETKEDGEMK